MAAYLTLMTPVSTRLLGPLPPLPAMEKMPPGAKGFPDDGDEEDDAAAAAAAAAMAAANSSSFLMAFCENRRVGFLDRISSCKCFFLLWLIIILYTHLFFLLFVVVLFHLDVVLIFLDVILSFVLLLTLLLLPVISCSS